MEQTMDDLSMWSYWAEKYGVVEALKQYYPTTLANNPSLQMSVHTIRVNLAFIDNLMRKAGEPK